MRIAPEPVAVQCPDRTCAARTSGFAIRQRHYSRADAVHSERSHPSHYVREPAVKLDPTDAVVSAIPARPNGYRSRSAKPGWSG